MILSPSISPPRPLVRFDVIYRVPSRHPESQWTVQVGARSAEEASRFVRGWRGEDVEIIDVVTL